MADVTVTVRNAVEGSQEVSNYANNLQRVQAAADRAGVRAAALKSRMEFLGKEVELGNMSLDDATKQYTEFRQSLGSVAQESQNTGKNVQNMGQRINDTLQTVQQSAVALGAAALTIKKGFDFAREGAQLTQIESSFNRLNEEVFKTPELLSELQRAAAGTIKDTELMSATLTLVAGTTGEVTQGLAQATPMLVEMARAASILNPAMGDAEFQLQSLSIAAKRQSRLLADNAGIMISMENAVKRVHPQLQGLADTYEQLPENLRFLNEMLFQGENLIEQAGGAAGSAVDPFDRLATQVEVLEDNFKQWLGEGLTPVVQVLNSDYAESVDAIVEKQQSFIQSTDDAIDAARRFSDAASVAGGLGPLITGTAPEVRQSIQDTASQMASLTENAEEFNEAVAEGFSGNGLAILRTYFQHLRITQEEFFFLARGAADARMNIAEFKRVVDSLELPNEEIEAFGSALSEAADADRVLTRGLTETEPEINAVSDALLTYEERREGIFSTEAFLAGLERERQGLSEYEHQLQQTQDAMQELMASEREMSFTRERDIVRGRDNAEEWVELYEEQEEAAEEVARAQEQAAAEAQRAIERYWNRIQSITDSALNSQMGLIDNLFDAYEELEDARDMAAADPTNEEAVSNLERAIERVQELTGDLSESWEEMVLGIITETGGFDQVAADFAVAAGIMSEAQAQMQLDAVATAQALEQVGLAIDQGAITPDQGAEIFNTILSGADNAEEAIAQAQAMLDELTGGGIDLGAAAEGGNIPPELQGMIEGFEMLPDAVQIDFSQVGGAITETNTLTEALSEVQSPEWVITVDDSQVTAAIEEVEILQLSLADVSGGATTVTQPAIGGIGHAHGSGGWRTVPPGYNESFPILLSAGEEYNVMTQQQARQARGATAQQAAPQQVDARTFIVANSEPAMALAMAQAREGRKRRHKQYMGVD